ncbi:hypothetical protein ACFL31_05215, partial [Candidatus Margulisiibacteriota bacterium]
MQRVIILGLFIMLVGSSAAIGDIVGSTDDPMTIGGGARPLGMGKAYSAVGDDADASFLNPAGLANFRGPQGMGMFTNLLGDIYYTEFCGATPSRMGVFGVGYVNTGVSEVLTPVGTSEVYSDYHDTMLVLTYATPLSRFFGYGRNVFLGANIKYFSRGWTGGVHSVATALSMDLGFKYVINPYLSFGLNRQNILPIGFGSVFRWPSGAEESISSIYKVGLAVRPKQFNKKLLIAFDADLPAQSG